MTSRGRSSADLLPSPWSAEEKKKEREREKRVVWGLGFAYPEINLEFKFVCKKAMKTYQIISRGFRYFQEVIAKFW
jgi:hypothetical protein